MVTAKKNIPEFIDKLISCFPSPDEFGQSVLVKLYQLLAEGKPVSHKDLAQAMDCSEKDIEQVFEGLKGIYRDEQGRIEGFWGIAALEETPHSLVVDGKKVHAWCAWDTLFIPEILQKTVQVTSECPVTKKEIRLIVSPKGIEKVEPEGVVISFLMLEKLDDNIVNSFCHYINFFTSSVAFAEWKKNHPDVFELSLNDAFIIGKKKNHHQFGKVL